MNNKQWRLPTIEELKSLLWGELPEGNKTGYVAKNPEVKAAFREAFGKDSDGWFWSSSANANFSGGAWIVHFNNSFVDYNNKDIDYKDDYSRVRLVRGCIGTGTWQDGDDPTTRYSLMSGTVTDNKTNLEWKRQPEDGLFNWQEVMKLFNKEEDKMTTITELEQKLAALQAKLAAIKAQPDPAEWQPKDGQWCVLLDGRVHCSTITRTEAEKRFGLHCERKEDAQEVSSLVSSYVRMFRWVKEHEDPKWKPDWSDINQERCQVFYDHHINRWRVAQAFRWQEPSIIYMSKPTAEKLEAALEAGLVL